MMKTNAYGDDDGDDDDEDYDDDDSCTVGYFHNQDRCASLNVALTYLQRNSP